jgi:hypothetical protein
MKKNLNTLKGWLFQFDRIDEIISAILFFDPFDGIRLCSTIFAVNNQNYFLHGIWWKSTKRKSTYYKDRAFNVKLLEWVSFNEVSKVSKSSKGSQPKYIYKYRSCYLSITLKRNRSHVNAAKHTRNPYGKEAKQSKKSKRVSFFVNLHFINNLQLSRRT